MKFLFQNKTSDGLSIPLTHNDQTKSSSSWFSLGDTVLISYFLFKILLLSVTIKTFFRTVIRDWIFLALLGFIMAALSFGMDYAIINLQNGQMRLFDLVFPYHFTLAYLVWVGYVVGLILLSAVCAHYIAPQAIGSGIPEMKTILRGVILKEYLSVRTLISKMVGLTLSLEVDCRWEKKDHSSMLLLSSLLNDSSCHESLQDHTKKEFFVNCAWTAAENNTYSCRNMTVDNFDLNHWTGGPNHVYSPFMTLAIFQTVYVSYYMVLFSASSPNVQFFLSILASTLPVPSGIFMPVFVLGAAFGRLVGEGVFTLYPDGYLSGDIMFFIRPGVYAVVGAAAFCGAVTHTVSVAVIVFEITGQLCHLLPVMIAVLIANAVASYLQPSIYDSIIRIKNLPYLPDIPHTTSLYHQMLIEQFMITPVVFIAKDSTIGDVKRSLESKKRIRAFPLVENLESLALVGSVSRSQLQRYIDSQIGTKARFAEATRRVKQRLEYEESERKRKDESKSDEAESSLTAKGAGERRASRFLIVPVAKGAPQISKNENLSGLSEENARKILTVEEKQALFDATSLTTLKEDINGKTVNPGQIESHHTIGDIFRSITHLSFGRQNFPKKSNHNEFDLYGDERIQWESSVLNCKIDLTQLDIDSTPFQLSEYTSLFKAHSLFSLLGLNRAYVTKKGQLIGVVALKELFQLRFAIEYLQAGKVPTLGMSIFNDNSNDQSSFEKSGRVESGMESQNPTFLTDNGEEDANDDYIQPPIEVIRRGALTPNQMSELSRVEHVRMVPESPHFDASSPSTSSSCVSIDLSPLDRTNSDDGSVGGLVLNVPSLPVRTKSAAELESRNAHVQINLPDDDVHEEKF
ncbi:hypothetical protein CAEBREN_30350 [Caenorhabditis brenneri]|uniref:CBS domain-containing protein n=1 Tax=Caenorhabditis brenneri TaxID=135651 RepID=G0PH71_CAEBE|nr:hypothetical protein CAEBREN_30350 [Caenorhabditis brenneri]